MDWTQIQPYFNNGGGLWILLIIAIALWKGRDLFDLDDAGFENRLVGAEFDVMACLFILAGIALVVWLVLRML